MDTTLSARFPFAAQCDPAPYEFNNGAWTLGGPVLIPGSSFNNGRNKLFFFFSQDILSRTDPGNLNQRRMPTDRENAPTPNVFYPLASGFPTRHMYPYLIRVRNVDTETLARHEHHGEEFMYVLEGQLEVTTYAEERQVK